MRLRSLVPFLLCVVTLATSCSSEPTLPTGAPSTMSFSYNGFRTGTFAATGFPPDVRTGTRWTLPWAAADNFTVTTNYTQVTGNQPAGTHNHIVSFILPQATTGTFRLGAAHQGFQSADAVIFDATPATGVGERYIFSSGTATITSAETDRVIGTFSGTAVDSVNHRSVTIANGTFNVYINQP